MHCALAAKGPTYLVRTRLRAKGPPRVHADWFPHNQDATHVNTFLSPKQPMERFAGLRHSTESQAIQLWSKDPLLGAISHT